MRAHIFDDLAHALEQPRILEDRLAHEDPVPAELAGVVESVHGLDTRPLAEPLMRPAASGQATTPLLPAQVARLYGVPTN